MIHVDITDPQSTIGIETLVPPVKWLVIASPGMPEYIVIDGDDAIPHVEKVLKLVGATWRTA